MDSIITQFSGGQYAPGMINAALPMVVEKLLDLLTQQTAALVRLSKAAMDATVNAAGNTLATSLAQAGTSLAGAAAGGANGITGGTTLNSMIAENTTFTGKLAKIDPPLEATKGPMLEFVDSKKGVEPLETTRSLGVDERQVQITKVDDPKTKTEEAVGKEDLVRQRKQTYQDHKQEQKTLSLKGERQKSYNQLLQFIPEVGTNALKGYSDKTQAEQQGVSRLADQAATASATSQGLTNTAVDRLIQLSDVQNYGSGMTK